MPETPFTSFTLGKYHPVVLLRRGGLGTIFRAFDTTLDCEVALQVLHPQLVSEPTHFTRICNEAKTITALRQLNVVDVSEVGKDYVSRIAEVLCSVPTVCKTPQIENLRARIAKKRCRSCMFSGAALSLDRLPS